MKLYLATSNVGNIDCCQKLPPPLMAVKAKTMQRVNMPSTGPDTNPKVSV